MRGLAESGDRLALPSMADEWQLVQRADAHGREIFPTMEDELLVFTGETDMYVHDAADGEWMMTQDQILPRLVASGDGERVDGMRGSEPDHRVENHWNAPIEGGS